MLLSLAVPALCIYLHILTAGSAETVLSVDIRKLELIHEVDERFLSFTIDSNLLARHWLHVSLRKVIALTKALTPAYVRIGGTDGDNLIFDTNFNFNSTSTTQRQETDCYLGNQSPDKISGRDIIRLGKFINATDTELIYGLNVLDRNISGWKPMNSHNLISFMNKHGIPVSGWELGNEPDRFRKVFNKTVCGKNLAKDFSRLKRLILRFPRYSNSLIIGPDVAHITKRGHSIRLLQKFLQHLKNDTLSRLTFHHYYFNGKNATVKDFLDAETMDSLKEVIDFVRDKTGPFQSHVPLWIGETSSGFGGGSPNVSDRFVSSFMWLDKLGQSALTGVQVVFRQTLLAPRYPDYPLVPRNCYNLIDPSHHPTPDYFVSYVYKKLVGKKVLNITNALTSSSNPQVRRNHVSNKIRLYAHCALSEDRISVDDGGVVLYGINVDDIPYRIKITGRSGTQIDEYLFTASGRNLSSRFCNLNGQRLKAGEDGELPLLKPRIRWRSFVVPPKTIGFWHLPNLRLTYCKYSMG